MKFQFKCKHDDQTIKITYKSFEGIETVELNRKGVTVIFDGKNSKETIIEGKLKRFWLVTTKMVYKVQID